MKSLFTVARLFSYFSMKSATLVKVKKWKKEVFFFKKKSAVAEWNEGRKENKEMKCRTRATKRELKQASKFTVCCAY